MRRAQWIHGPVTDTALAFAWLPLAVVAHAVSSTPAHLRTLVGLIFLLSFAHQPLTLAPCTATEPSWSLSAPLCGQALSLPCGAGSVISLTAVAIAAGLWNAILPCAALRPHVI